MPRQQQASSHPLRRKLSAMVSPASPLAVLPGQGSHADRSPARSRNCTKHKIRCPYNDVQVPDAERSTTPDKPDLMWTPQIEAAIGEWQATGVFPFPSLGVYPAPMPHMYPVEDLRLIYHVASLYHQLASIDANNFTLWTRHIPTYVVAPSCLSPASLPRVTAVPCRAVPFITC